jgi:hypothetical protein
MQSKTRQIDIPFQFYELIIQQNYNFNLFFK